ncbi:enoyl-CoA hydratase [Sinomonas atrocyanea]|uniref:enoyl-CoA hydratase/isomerase family protein n=1 Tax=Sinomonas atrocyanea TaxID=37927 RepID=UPI00278A564C|nr:enoyl-CoA hydratase/isomerase family protein [Sinomonas atrocyanea]MDP9884566.1 enoyl-CoA hydratase [Sinomonas atrocyanea]
MTGVAVQAADVTVDDDGSLAVVTFGTGRRLNALRTEHWEALARTAASLAGRNGLRAVVLRGRGGVFCAGSDLREWEHAPMAEVDRSFWQLEQALRAIEDLPMPTVAVIEGVAAGGGCQLALACDLQITAATAQVGMPISRLGILPSAPFAARMALRIGPSRTKDLLYGGRMLSGEEAHRIGLVSTLAADGEVEAELGRLLAQWAALAPASLRAAKAAVDRGLQPITGPARREPPGPAVDAEDFPPRIAAFFDRRR